MIPPDEFLLPRSFDYLATFLWALSGAIVGMHKRYDFTGVLVIAVLASTGGSLLRDGLFLNTTPPILTNGVYLLLIVTATLIVGFFRQRIANVFLVDRVISVIDAVGIPVFAVVGMQLSLNAGISLPGVVLVGVINGTGGGLLRDVIVGDTPAILVPGQYLVSALILVCILFLVFYQYFGIPQFIAAWSMIGLYFVIRMASIRFNWRTQPVLRDPPE
jgi:uncharacterized membrane protein YeiH